jgi:hypothetical protein
MALNAGEQLSGGNVVDASGRLVVVADALPSSVGSANSSPFTMLEAAGHSWAAGVAATNSHGYAAKLATILGITITPGILGQTSYAVGGSILASDNQSPAGNGFAWLLQTITRANGGSPWAPGSGLVLIQHGANDLAKWGSGAGPISAIQSAMRVVLSRFRSAATGVFENNDATVVFGSGWAAYNGGANYFYSGTTCQYTSTNASTVTISVPASFPGGTIAIGTPALAAGGAIFSASVDGGTAITWDTRTISQAVASKAVVANVTGYVKRLTGLAAGAHTIIITVSSITSFAYFDYWEAETPDPPTILLLLQPRLTANGYTDLGGGLGDTDIQKLNVALLSLAAEFGPAVIPVHLDQLFGANAAYYTTTVGNREHPNDAGHSLIATACLAALQTAQGPWLPTLATAS